MGLSSRIFSSLDRRNLMKWMPDEMYLRVSYYLKFHKKLNLHSPETFNEKLQWLKLNNRDPIHTTMVDKYEVKKYVSNIIGQEYVIDTIGIWDAFDDIDFDSLPRQFVIKCTHDSGGLVICRDKDQLDMDLVRKKIERCFKRNYYWYGREFPYKDVRPRILAEKYMENKGTVILPVYKIFNFNGEPYLIQAIQNDKSKQETIDYFDTSWNLLDLRQNFPNSKVPLAKPEKLDEMLTLSKQLSTGFPFLRVDFYCINGRVYFSEFTFFSDSGLAEFYPDSWDMKLGKLIELS